MRNNIIALVVGVLLGSVIVDLISPPKQKVLRSDIQYLQEQIDSLGTGEDDHERRIKILEYHLDHSGN